MKPIIIGLSPETVAILSAIGPSTAGAGPRRRPRTLIHAELTARGFQSHHGVRGGKNHPVVRVRAHGLVKGLGIRGRFDAYGGKGDGGGARGFQYLGHFDRLVPRARDDYGATSERPRQGRGIT